MISKREDTRFIVGMDFGTTTSAVGVVKNDNPHLLPVDDGAAVMPSVVAFGKNGEVLVGGGAKRQAVLNPERTYHSIKRRMGERETYAIDGKEWSPSGISAQILLRLRKEAGKTLGREVIDAVITVPAYFNQLQRQAVKEAGKLAGLNVVRIINEPTAAAMAYGVNLSEEQNILVFDFGGGTFDVSILNIADGVFEVKATGGDNRLGGDDIDLLIIDRIVKDFRQSRGIDLSTDKVAMQKLKDEAENLKIALSSSESARLRVPFITADQHGPIHIDCTFTTAMLDSMCEPLIRRLVSIAERTIKSSGLKKSDVDRILLAGGSTRIPAVRSAIEKHFGLEKILDGVNPIECVALGAAVQAAIIGGEIEQRVLVDVTPLTLGLEIEGGETEPLIQKNSPIPASAKKVFTTLADFQKEVEIKILQGNSNRALENVSLGSFILDNLQKAKKGVPQVEVEFDINVDGIMNVAARDKNTGSRCSIRIDRKDKHAQRM
ncbi:MAG: chaperone protein DnaK [bacterium]|nr:MAG: chaperone protein DnaK [bacterium]